MVTQHARKSILYKIIEDLLPLLYITLYKVLHLNILKEAQNILLLYGINVTTGIRTYFKVIVCNIGIPLELRPRTGLEQANYEANPQMSYKFEDCKKTMH